MVYRRHHNCNTDKGYSISAQGVAGWRFFYSYSTVRTRTRPAPPININFFEPPPPDILIEFRSPPVILNDTALIFNLVFLLYKACLQCEFIT